jgi:hypothetical protein
MVFPYFDYKINWLKNSFNAILSFSFIGTILESTFNSSGVATFLTVFMAIPIAFLIRYAMDWRLKKLRRKQSKEKYKFKDFFEVEIITRNLAIESMVHHPNEDAVELLIKHFNNATT